MGIREAEEATGISRQNIRFYEKQGLLHPARNKRNSYREYSDEDILRLKQIRLFRKLGMPLDEIRRLLDGEVDLMQALEEQERRLAVEAEHLKASRQFIKKIHDTSLDEMDVDRCLQSMEEEEKRGAVFGKFAEDYIPADMSKDRYNRVRRIYRIVNVCFFLLIIVGGVYSWKGNAGALIIPLLAFAVYIGVLIRWRQKNK